MGANSSSGQTDLKTHLDQAFAATEEFWKKLRYLLGPNYIEFFIQTMIEFEPGHNNYCLNKLSRHNSWSFQIKYKDCDLITKYEKAKDLDNAEQKTVIERTVVSRGQSYNIIDGYSFSYDVHLCTSSYVKRNFDILIGLYFPKEHYQVGDVLEVIIGPWKVCEIKLDKLDKIYKPIYDTFWCLLISLQYYKVEVKLVNQDIQDNQDRPFYAIGLQCESDPRRALAQRGHEYVLPNGKVMRYMGGFSQTVDIPDYVEKLGLERYNFYPYIYFANMIKRNMRSYVYRQKVMRKKKAVFGELKALPDLGIDYFEAMSRFSLYQQNI